MQAFTHFSRHAFKRVIQRTRLSCEEIASILDRKLTVNTGEIPGFNRNHLVFYSIPDDNYFVAIQDAITGTVVTILPLDFHANLAWKISDNDCLKAKNIIVNNQSSTQEITNNPKPTMFVLSGHFLNTEGKQKTKVIHRTNSEPYGDDIKKLLLDQSIFSNLNKFAESKGIEMKYLFGVSIRLGNRGAPVTINLNELSCAYD